MRNKTTVIAIVFALVLGLGIVNIIYAQGPDDGEPVTPCEFHAMMHTEDCPFADEDGLPSDWMNENGACWHQEDGETAMPFGSRGMMGMGSRGMMNNGQHMHDMWNIDTETMPLNGMPMMSDASYMHDMWNIDTDTMPHNGMPMMDRWAGNSGACPFNVDIEADEIEIPEEPTSAEIGDVENGELLFAQNVCSACHDVNNNTVFVGPSLVGISERAETQSEDLSAYTYLYQSVVMPNSHVVDGFSPNLMPPTFSQILTQAQINDIIAYLLTL